MDEDLLTMADERSLTAAAGTLRAIADQPSTVTDCDSREPIGG
ncbi:hypothetical protein ACFQMM_13570 [Saliphagus sp. GCM10025308]